LNSTSIYLAGPTTTRWARDGFALGLSWSGSVLQRASGQRGPLAVLAPLLEQLDVAAILNRHGLPDPLRAFAHRQVLPLLLGARWLQPLALVPDAGGAEEADADAAAQVGRLHRAGHAVVCSVAWSAGTSLFQEHRERLLGNNARYLSVEQQRRRACHSVGPRER
jgi:hypothetical protein